VMWWCGQWGRWCGCGAQGDGGSVRSVCCLRVHCSVSVVLSLRVRVRKIEMRENTKKVARGIIIIAYY
jgi:hypothetical protein